MMMKGDIKKEINNSLKEIQENTTKQVKELNKTIQDLKMEVETMKKSQRETTLKIENLENKSGANDASITNRVQEIKERISGAEDTIENIGTTIKENVKCKKIITQNTQEVKGTMRRSNLSIDEKEDFQLKGPVNIFNKIIEENFPNLKKEMPMNIQEAYRTPNRLDQKRNSSHHIIIKTPNAQNKERILKPVKEKGQETYKVRPIRITPDFSPENLKARRL
jgi:chromosome segregation ATPase